MVSAAGVLPDCPPNWEYSHLPTGDDALKTRTKNLLRTIARLDVEQLEALAKNTRPAHGVLLAGLTPQHFPYFAGHYRGEPRLRCLDVYEVRIGNDPRVGHTAATVPMEMQALSEQINVAVLELNRTLSAPTWLFSKQEKLVRLTHVIAAIFVYFLEIHPFANGNGHMARLLVITLFKRFGHLVNPNWNIHPRPLDPPYSPAIVDYRNGNPAPLVQLLLKCL